MKMNIFSKLNLNPGRGICYSGFRDGQSPETGVFPSYEEVRNDLMLLHDNWDYLRLYDCDLHAEMILEVIHDEKLNFKVMQGAYIAAEINNANCPWGGTYTDAALAENKAKNEARIEKLIHLANQYPDIIFSLSAGNEATVDWTDHLVPVASVIDYVKRLKAAATQPVTFCENYLPWQHKLNGLAEVVDFISIHTYPVWEYKSVLESMDYTLDNYFSVANMYPDKPVVITEAGWATNSNGRGIDPTNVSEEFQQIYSKNLIEWSEKSDILTFLFEAFDEPWKGSGEPDEPEKHWGIFNVNREPKLAGKMLLGQINR
ncbi:MAG: hypothetical protein ABJN36_02065 [Cyclobacteriaceae bacterium]